MIPGPSPITDAIFARAASYAARWKAMAAAAGVPWDEVTATARAALVDAARDYDPDRGPFWPFARTRVGWELGRLIESERPHEDRRVALGFSDPADPAPDPTARIEIVDALDALPPFPRKIVELAFGLVDGEEQSVRTIAMSLKVSPNTVKATLADALETLRQVLNP